MQDFFLTAGRRVGERDDECGMMNGMDSVDIAIAASAEASEQPEALAGQVPQTQPPAASLAGASAASEQPCVIVMHASVGSGHRSAANAVAQAFDQLRGQDGVPEDVRVEVLDVLDFGRIVFDGNRAASLFTGATRPIYDLTWRYTFTGRLLWGGGTIWSRIMFPAFTEHVRTVRPLAVVCTHITAANVAVGARMVTGQAFPVVCVPTDYETEGLWPHQAADLFCVATEAMAETLRPRRVPEEKILITGIPTRADFRCAYDKEATREKWGLPQDKTVVLALAGAYLPQPYVHFRESLDQVLPYAHTLSGMHVVFVTGEDEKYANHVRRECADLGLQNVTVLGYVDEMAALMAASDVAICKSGGLTVTECLCARVPMVLMGRAYGQENINVRMLTSCGAARHITTPRELLATLRYIDAHPESTRSMLVNGAFLRRPDAAGDVARAAMRLAAEKAARAEQGAAPERRRFLHLYWGGRPAHTR